MCYILVYGLCDGSLGQYSIVQKMDFRMRNLKQNKQSYNSMVEFPRNTVDFPTISNTPDLTSPKIKQVQIRLTNLSEALRADSQNNSLLFAQLEQRVDQLERRPSNFEREGSRLYTKYDTKERNTVGGGQDLVYFKQSIINELGAIKDEMRGQTAKGDQVEARQGRLEQELREWIGHQKQEISMKLLSQAEEIRGTDIGRQRSYQSQLNSLRCALVALQEEIGGKMRAVAGLKQEMGAGLQSVRDEARGDKEAVSRLIKELKESFQGLKDAISKDRQNVKQAIFELQSSSQEGFNKNNHSLEAVVQGFTERYEKVQKRLVSLRDQWGAFKLNANQKIEDCKSLIVNVESTTLQQLQVLKARGDASAIQSLKEQLQQWKKLTEQKNLNVFRQISNAMKVTRMQWRKEHDDLIKQQQDTVKSIKNLRYGLIDRLEKQLATISQLNNEQFDAFTGELEQASDLIALSNKEFRTTIAKQVSALTDVINMKSLQMQKRVEAVESLVNNGTIEAIGSLKAQIQKVKKDANAQIQNLVSSITEDNQQWAKEINSITTKLKQNITQEINVAIQGQDKKYNQNNKKAQESLSALKLSLQAGLTTQRTETGKQISKATEQVTNLMSDWITKAKKQHQGSENGLKQAISQQKRTIDKDIADAKLIFEDLKTKSALKVTEDAKKHSDLKTFVQQGLAKAGKANQQEQAKISKRVDTLKMELQGKIKAANQKVLLDISTKKDSQVKAREEESKAKASEMEKKIGDATIKLKGELMAQISKVSRNTEQKSSETSKKIEAATVLFKKDLQAQVEKDKKFCIDQIAKVKSQLEIKMKAKDEKALNEANAKRDLQIKQKDEELKGKLVQIEKKIIDTTSKTKSEVLGQVSKAKTAQLEQLGKIKSQIQNKIKAFEELKGKKEAESKARQSELKGKEEQLKNKTADQDKKIESLKKEIQAQAEKSKKYCLDEINKAKIEIQGKGNTKKEAEMKQKDDELKNRILQLQKKTSEASAKSKAQLSSELTKSQAEISKLKFQVQNRMKAFQEIKNKKEADSKAKESEIKDKQAELKAKSAELDKKIQAAKKDLTKVTLDENSKLRTQIQAKILALNQQFDAKLKTVGETSSKGGAQQKAKSLELQGKIDSMKGDIDKRLAQIKGNAMVNLKAQEQQTNKLLDQKLQNLKAYFSQAMQTSTGATAASFKGIEERLNRLTAQNELTREETKGLKDWLNQIEAIVASEKLKNKSVYDKMSSDILDMADSITVMVAEMRPSQK